MPKYLYECTTCEKRFLVYHLMSEKLEACEKCGSENCLKKLPLFPINLQKNKKEQKVGDVVKQYIKDANDDLKQEKRDLITKEHDK